MSAATATLAVSAAATTKTVKEFTLKLDADTASKLLDVLYRNVSVGDVEGSISKISSALMKAGVENRTWFKNTNKAKSSSYGYLYPSPFAILVPTDSSY